MTTSAFPRKSIGLVKPSRTLSKVRIANGRTTRPHASEKPRRRGERGREKRGRQETEEG